LIVFGGSMAAFLALVLLIKCAKQKKFSFSLRWLLLMTISTGLCVGGIARRSLALKEAARYESELWEFKNLPDDEKPAHLVTLTQPFYMGKYTVTQEQYTAMMGNNPSFNKGAQLPVEQVSWDDATAFCNKLTGKLQDKALEVRLPTEAQWEYACRAGTRTRFYSGDLDNDMDSVGWYNYNSGRTTHPVGLKKPNAFGLYDMHGNVWQWCEDVWSEHYEALQAMDPVNEQGANRVLRGGCWSDNPRDCRSANREGEIPEVRYASNGFRVVVAASSTTP